MAPGDKMRQRGVAAGPPQAGLGPTDTVWLTQGQMAELFGWDKSVISRHLRSIFETRELDRQAVVAKIATAQTEGARQVVREIEYFDLDAILSVGYRVNAKRGIHFRSWATRTPRNHLVQGYTLNERRRPQTGMAEMEQAVRLLVRTLSAHELVTGEGRAERLAGPGASAYCKPASVAAPFTLPFGGG